MTIKIFCLGVSLTLASLALVSTAHAAGRYHSPGHQLNKLPRQHHMVRVNRRPYYYHRGQFFEPRRQGYVVVSAPFGAAVPSLPAGYVSFGIGSRRYYHVNATYYLWRDRQQDYVVVKKPVGADEALPRSTEVAQSASVFVYPRDGQDETMRDQDRYQCHQWAKQQTGYDPSTAQSADTRANSANGGDYKRAITACLEGRGYTVR